MRVNNLLTAGIELIVAIGAVSASILASNVIPTHYRISMVPDISNATFTGKIAVQLDIRERTSSIVFNAVKLDIHSALLNASGGSVGPSNITLDEELQHVTLDFAEELEPGITRVLEIDFS